MSATHPAKHTHYPQARRLVSHKKKSAAHVKVVKSQAVGRSMPIIGTLFILTGASLVGYNCGMKEVSLVLHAALGTEALFTHHINTPP